MGDAWPGALRGRAHDAEDAHKLVFVRGAGEERTTGVHLCHDTACGPDVDAGIVGSASKENIGGSIPEGYDFVGERVDWDSKRPCKTEISKL